MFGSFQQSQLRIELAAQCDEIARCLLYPAQLQDWLWPQHIAGAPDKLVVGAQFTSSVGPIALRHHIVAADDNRLRSLLSESIDGFHEWYWGDGWVQSRLEGVSLLPLKLLQSVSLMRLQAQFPTQHPTSDAPGSPESPNAPELPHDSDPDDTADTAEL